MKDRGERILTSAPIAGQKRNVLLPGSGGREHALSLLLSRSPHVHAVYCAPGNAGTQNNINIDSNDIYALLRFAKGHSAFTVVGSENLLAHGIVDLFTQNGLEIFGPTTAAAKIETSKVQTKLFMGKYEIPTVSDYGIFNTPEAALYYLRWIKHPVVIKPDGLSGGKGVIVQDDNTKIEEAAIRNLMKDNREILIERKIKGREVSYIVITDGTDFVPLTAVHDYKRIGEGDSGANTGGMGAYSPVPFVNEALERRIQDEIITKAIRGMKDEGRPFVGFLYAGLMIVDGNPIVLEFNARMGDPEAAPIAARMKSNIFEYLDAALKGTLFTMPAIQWRKQSAVTVVLANRGYPLEHKTGEEITGLDTTPDTDFPSKKRTINFHSGTKITEHGRIIAEGGRVIQVTALGKNLRHAIYNAYGAADKINWPNKYLRKDIGRDGLNR